MQRNRQAYEINVLKIGTDGDHVHFLIQSVPTFVPTSIVKIIKSIQPKKYIDCIQK